MREKERKGGKRGEDNKNSLGSGNMSERESGKGMSKQQRLLLRCTVSRRGKMTHEGEREEKMIAEIAFLCTLLTRKHNLSRAS